MAGEKTDILTPVAIVGGVAAIGFGTWWLMKKGAGVSPGESLFAHFKFDYEGAGGTYVLQVYFGHSLVGAWFDHVWGCSMEVTLDRSDTYEFDLLCDIPEGTKAGKYDAEALIRTPEMDEFTYFVKHITEGAITVRKEA